eukprot:GHVH01001915.1.p1 GENE.GHVH01001915.1~~GHVH01001915.1.p1  ORF type:complete len:1196 (+),score=199.06 GHVH01001915.1:1841-5428(+)
MMWNWAILKMKVSMRTCLRNEHPRGSHDVKKRVNEPNEIITEPVKSVNTEDGGANHLGAADFHYRPHDGVVEESIDQLRVRLASAEQCGMFEEVHRHQSDKLLDETKHSPRNSTLVDQARRLKRSRHMMSRSHVLHNSDDNTRREVLSAAKPSIKRMKPAAECEPSEPAVVSKGSKQKTQTKLDMPSLIENATLKNYQVEGFNWLAALHDNNVNGILADEMGLGKTLQTICLLAYLAEHHGIWGPHLIVVPSSLLLNWEAEFFKFLPGFKLLTYYGDKKAREAKRKGWTAGAPFNCLITSYSLAVSDAQYLKRRAWYYLILDEAHALKNAKSIRWQQLLSYRTQRRLLLTGTPIQNNLSELWSLLHFIMPLLFPSFEDWNELFASPLENAVNQCIVKDHKRVLSALHSIIRPFILRRLKSDVESEMPSKVEHVIKCPMSIRQKVMYNEYLEFRSRSVQKTDRTTEFRSMMNVMMELRKIVNHPDMILSRDAQSCIQLPFGSSISLSMPDQLDLRLRNGYDGLPLHARLRCCDIMQRPAVDRLAPLQWSIYCHHENEAFSLHPNDLARRSRWWRTAKTPVCSPYHPYIEERVTPKHGISELAVRHKHLLQLKFMPHPKIHISTTPKVLFPNKLSLDDMWHRGPEVDVSIDEPIEVSIPNCSAAAPSKAKAHNEKSEPKIDATVIWNGDVQLATKDEKFRTLEEKLCHAGLPPGMELRVPVGSASVPATLLPHLLCDDQQDLERIQTLEKFLPAPKESIELDSGKIAALGRVLRDKFSEGSKVLLFTQMSKMLDILESYLSFKGYNYLRLDGSTKIESRQAMVDRFNMDEKVFIFLASTRAGGVGLNLTGANIVIFYDSDWNPSMDRQAMDRCHRIGQTKDVHILRFITGDTVEENIWRKQLQKRLLDELVVDKGQFQTSQHDRFMTKSDVSQWLGLSDLDEAVDEADKGIDIYATRVLHESKRDGDGALSYTATVDKGNELKKSTMKIINALGRSDDSGIIELHNSTKELYEDNEGVQKSVMECEDEVEDIFADFDEGEDNEQLIEEVPAKEIYSWGSNSLLGRMEAARQASGGQPLCSVVFHEWRYRLYLKLEHLFLSCGGVDETDSSSIVPSNEGEEIRVIPSHRISSTNGSSVEISPLLMNGLLWGESFNMPASAKVLVEKELVSLLLQDQKALQLALDDNRVLGEDNDLIKV